MDFRRLQKSICMFIVLCILLLGMCPNGASADSCFLRANSAAARTTTDHAGSAHPASILTDSAIRPIGSTVPAQQAYTKETLSQYETVLTPKQSEQHPDAYIGRTNGSVFAIVDILPRLLACLSATDSYRIYDDNICSTVIITYIHHQDGEKA